MANIMTEKEKMDKNNTNSSKDHKHNKESKEMKDNNHPVAPESENECKNNKEQKEAQDTKDSKAATKPAPPPKPKTELEIAKEEKCAAEKEASEWKDKFMFLQAELENTRKHYIRQQEVTRNRTKIDVITRFTPLLESLDFAIQNMNKIKDKVTDPQVANFFKGFENLKQSIMSIFDSLDVKAIDAMNKPFDLKYHEAVMTMERPDLPDDTVIQVVQTGYMIDKEVIRPAKVIVSKKPQPQIPDEPSQPVQSEQATAEKKETPQESKKTEC
jgi:molecular chaperone GrpE